MRRISESLFRAVCLGFSALLLVLFLLTSIDIASERERQSRLWRETETIEEENELLRARVEERLSLEAIERYASEKLGMQPMRPGQLIYLELKE